MILALFIPLYIVGCIERIKEGQCYSNYNSQFVKVLKRHEFGVSYKKVSAKYEEYDSFENFRAKYSTEVDCIVFQEKK